MMNISATEQSIKDIQVLIKSEPLAKRKAALTGQLHKTEDALVKMKKSKDLVELTILGKPEKGQIGLLQARLMVHAIIDDDTAILRDELTAVIIKMPTKGLKARTLFRSDELWEVTDIGGDAVDVKRYVPDTARMFGCFTAKPLKAADVKRFRQAYEEQKKLAQ